MSRSFRAFAVSVVWTLGLLFLGSVVHATESSLACPDWPTCFGTMFPEMTGGVFWEHLHRLVAGGLILLFGGATFLAFRETRPGHWIRTASMALVFLSLATLLATVASPRRAERPALDATTARSLRSLATPGAVLVFLQSVVGGVVRHTDAGMACPDIPTCIGEWVPPLSNGLVATHFLHRVLGVVVTLAVLWMAWRLLGSRTPTHVRRLAVVSGLLVVAQMTLGIVSVLSLLAVVPVSLHTLGAASLLAALVTLATWGWLGGSPAREAAAATDRFRPGSVETAVGGA